MKKILSIFLLLVTPLMAVLPPAAQSKREIQAILESSGFQESIPSGDVVEEIKKVEGGYVVITNKRVVPILVHYAKTKEIGPSRFTLEFQEAIPLDLEEEPVLLDDAVILEETL